MSKKFLDGYDDLRAWAVHVRLPELVESLGLTAGALCGSLSESVRRTACGATENDPLPDPIDWSGNSIVISPPGTGKGMAIFVEALAHYDVVYVLVPSVVQAHALERSLDTLYHERLGGCQTSQRKAKGLIWVMTTGVFHQMVGDTSSDLWNKHTVLIVDEAQRILEDDPQTEFMVGYMASQGLPTVIVSATIAPGTLPEVFGHDGVSARVYSLEKSMHPVDITVERGDDPLKVLKRCGMEAGATTLIFAPSRAKVSAIVARITEDEACAAVAVPVTGAHDVETQLAKVKNAQASGAPVVVVATPGTMDSSVTVPGLTTVIIMDERIRVDWNKDGVRERRTETLPINHIWQMVRRVGRERRVDGKRDRVIVLSSSARTDVLAEVPAFEPLAGCSPHTPVEDLLLSAVRLDVRFGDVHEYMLSTFEEAHIAEARERLLRDGMIRHVDDPSDPDGFALTERGALVEALPFDYGWSRLVVEAPEELRLFVALAASCGPLRNLVSFETEFQALEHPQSDLLSRILLCSQYLELGHDEWQAREAKRTGMSFRRLEQMEALFGLAMEGLDLDWSPATLFEAPFSAERFLGYVVRKGLEIGVFDLYLLAEGKGGWSEVRPTADAEHGRRFVLEKGTKLALEESAQGGVCAVVATATWFRSRSGAPMANLDDVSIVPRSIVAEVVRQRAQREGWFELTFTGVERFGEIEPQVRKDGTRYVPSRKDNAPEVGRPYWCSVDRNLGPVTAVWVQYPVE